MTTEALPPLPARSIWTTHPPYRFIDGLLEAELAARDERRVRTSLRLSGLPAGQTLSSNDIAFQPSVERSRIETPPGVGKTHLSIALGVGAVENGFSVALHRLEDLLAALKCDANVSPRRLRQRKPRLDPDHDEQGHRRRRIMARAEAGRRRSPHNAQEIPSPDTRARGTERDSAQPRAIGGAESRPDSPALRPPLTRSQVDA